MRGLLQRRGTVEQLHPASPNAELAKTRLYIQLLTYTHALEPPRVPPLVLALLGSFLPCIHQPCHVRREATSQRTLRMLSTMFEKASLRTTELPVVSKAHDDLFLTCVAHRRTLLLAKRVDRLTVLAALPASPSANAPAPTAIAALRASSLKCGTGPTQTRRLCARSSFFQTSTRTSRPARACHRGGQSAYSAHVTSRYACLAPVECTRNADGLSLVCAQNYVYILVRGGRAVARSYPPDRA